MEKEKNGYWEKTIYGQNWVSSEEEANRGLVSAVVAIVIVGILIAVEK